MLAFPAVRLSFRIDHLVVLVADLAAAIDDYRGLGFTVLPGGEHAGGRTHNALIVLEDDTYLELIAFRRPDFAAPGEGEAAATPAGLARFQQRLRQRAGGGEGLVDLALLPSNLEAALAGARARGAGIDGPFPGRRVRPDGRAVAWAFAFPSEPELPFLCADVTPRELRVPGGEARRHANGAEGIAAVEFAVRDGAEARKRFGGLLGLAVEETETAGAAVRLGPAELRLVAPGGGEDGAAAAHLAERGAGPWRLLLRAGPNGRRGVLDRGRTHGARIRIV